MSQVPSSVYQIHPNTYNFSQYTGSWQSSTTTALPNRNNLYVFEGDVSSTVNATQMFRGCSKLRSLHLYNANNFTDTTRMLSGCTYLIEVNVQDWDVSKVTNMKGMFYNTGNFEADFSTWDVSGVTDFDEMFYDSEIKTVDMSNWKHPNSSRMKNMFANSTVETVVFGDTSGVYTMDSIFTGCKALKSVTMTYPLSSSLSNSSMFSSVTTEGIFYYNPAYDYSMIIAKLPATWTAVPIS